MALKDDFKVTLECPGCAKKITRSVRQLEGQRELKCPGCGARIDVRQKQPGSIGASLDKLDNALRKLGAKQRR